MTRDNSDIVQLTRWLLGAGKVQWARFLHKLILATIIVTIPDQI